jgi:ribonuclease HI
MATEDLEFDDFRIALRKTDSVEIYTDGSCRGNPGPGGWGCVFVCRDKRSNISGFEKNTTNNRMELMAAIQAIKAMPSDVKMSVYTDSTYVKNGITIWINNWKRNNWILANNKPVKNKDLWLELSEIISNKNIEWSWVKGHADCTNNNNADFVAKSAIVASYMEE